MKKNNVGVVLVVSILISFICGSLGAYFIVLTNKTNTIFKNFFIIIQLNHK